MVCGGVASKSIGLKELFRVGVLEKKFGNIFMNIFEDKESFYVHELRKFLEKSFSCMKS